MDDSLVERLKTLVNEFDPAAFIPEVGSIIGWVELFTRICVMAAPLIMLVLGLIYLFLPPKEANHTLGYRFYFGMGSVEAWRFTQKLAGIIWSSLGLVLSVVMLLISNKFRGMDALEMADKAVACILWELGLIVVSCLAINIVVLFRYDRKGNRRSSKKSV
jgi:uncharacterized membrane protein